MARSQITIRIPRADLLPLHLRELLWEDPPPELTVSSVEAPVLPTTVRACFEHAVSGYSVTNR